MSGFESWVPIAVLAARIPFVKAKPTRLLREMVGLWLQPEELNQTDDQIFAAATAYAKTNKATFRTLPGDDPYWETHGVLNT